MSWRTNRRTGQRFRLEFTGVAVRPGQLTTEERSILDTIEEGPLTQEELDSVWERDTSLAVERLMQMGLVEEVPIPSHLTDQPVSHIESEAEQSRRISRLLRRREYKPTGAKEPREFFSHTRTERELRELRKKESER